MSGAGLQQGAVKEGHLLVGEAGTNWGDQHLAIARGGQSTAAYGHFVVTQERKGRTVLIAQREFTTIADQRRNRAQRGAAAQRPDHVGKILRKIGMARQLYVVLRQQRLPIRCCDEPLAAPVQYAMRQQYALILANLEFVAG